MEAIQHELARQSDQIELIASENLVSRAVMQAQGCVMTNKYAEGYPRKRYYGGCEYVDEVEDLARLRACELFGCNFANVQPHSGSQANQAVFSVAMSPGDKFMGMALDQGGHLTHGASVNMSGKWFEAHFYGIDPVSGEIDYDKLATQAKQVQPKLIIAGASAHPRIINFEKFAAIAKDVGAYLMVDMAHIAGLVATGAHPDPFPHADFVTTTTHKTLRGPRGGMILTNDEELAQKVDSAIFPGLQGGPLMHVIAAKAVAFAEALQPEFKNYIAQVVKNAAAMGEALKEQDLDLITGGTDNHLLLVDLRKLGVSGKAAEKALEQAGLTCNKNAVPNDPKKPWITSGIRLGSPAGTSRGFKEEEFRQIGSWIGDIVRTLPQDKHGDGALIAEIRSKVHNMCARFPIYDGGLA